MSRSHDTLHRMIRDNFRRFGKAVARGDCRVARKLKTVLIRDIAEYRDRVGARHAEKFENAISRAGTKLDRCYIRTGYHPPGRSR